MILTCCVLLRYERILCLLKTYFQKTSPLTCNSGSDLRFMIIHVFIPYISVGSRDLRKERDNPQIPARSEFMSTEH